MAQRSQYLCGHHSSRIDQNHHLQRMCLHLILQVAMQSEINLTVQDEIYNINGNAYWTLPYPASFQASLTGFFLLEIVLGLSSNLTVLALYCMKSNLINSVSNIITMNLHILDVVICIGCIPLTIIVTLISLESKTALICNFHEACISFASVATAVNVLAITLDRYDISVKPATRILTMRRAITLLTSVWIVSLSAFTIPFIEVSFFNLQSNENTWQNNTLLCIGVNEYHKELGIYYHLLMQIPIFIFTVIVMLITYRKILQALNIRIGSRFSTRQKKTKGKKTVPLTIQHENTNQSESNRRHNAILGVRTSVSVIIALRRAVKRHRERRERQKRVFRMSLLIISSFLICWTPISVLNTVILYKGLDDVMVKLRLCFLIMAYGTTIFHPLLYAFARQKFQKVLKNKMKKKVVSIIEADPNPNNPVIHNSWLYLKRNKR
ncbi:G-protein coupled receptor 22 [Scyliorhinus canicula]|uniref:G-protein coupled receptor 22 n=1 Tax=Scyliorhinus canicula TaxID=7830 RepID=UPI0018F658D9|nr:G-protein coupled receptor 22 [Scyliorhinus canicula]